MSNISIIVAMNKKSVIGINGEIPWRIPSDLKRFAKITKNHPVIMGRKTCESIIKELGHPLNNRTNIVMTRRKNYSAKGCVVVSTTSKAFAAAMQSEGSEEIFIIGGAEIYKLFLPYATRLYVTIVDEYDKDGDITFTKIDAKAWSVAHHEKTMKYPEDEYPSSFTIYELIKHETK